jgi:hypothetical protein
MLLSTVRNHVTHWCVFSVLRWRFEQVSLAAPWSTLVPPESTLTDPIRAFGRLMYGDYHERMLQSASSVTAGDYTIQKHAV